MSREKSETSGYQRKEGRKGGRKKGREERKREGGKEGLKRPLKSFSLYFIYLYSLN